MVNKLTNVGRLIFVCRGWPAASNQNVARLQQQETLWSPLVLTATSLDTIHNCGRTAQLKAAFGKEFILGTVCNKTQFLCEVYIHVYNNRDIEMFGRVALEFLNYPLVFYLHAASVLFRTQGRYLKELWAGIPQSVQRLATGWTVRGSNPGGGARFSAPLQTVPGAHPASYTMVTASLPGVKRSGRGVDNPPPSSAEVKERVELYIFYSSGLSWSVLG